MKQILLVLVISIFTTDMITAQETELVVLHTNDTHGIAGCGLRNHP